MQRGFSVPIAVLSLVLGACLMVPVAHQRKASVEEGDRAFEAGDHQRALAAYKTAKHRHVTGTMDRELDGRICATQAIIGLDGAVGSVRGCARVDGCNGLTTKLATCEHVPYRHQNALEASRLRLVDQLYAELSTADASADLSRALLVAASMVRRTGSWAPDRMAAWVEVVQRMRGLLADPRYDGSRAQIQKSAAWALDCREIPYQRRGECDGLVTQLEAPANEQTWEQVEADLAAGRYGRAFAAVRVEPGPAGRRLRLAAWFDVRAKAVALPGARFAYQRLARIAALKSAADVSVPAELRASSDVPTRIELDASCAATSLRRLASLGDVPARDADIIVRIRACAEIEVGDVLERFVEEGGRPSSSDVYTATCPGGGTRSGSSVTHGAGSHQCVVTARTTHGRTARTTRTEYDRLLARVAEARVQIDVRTAAGVIQHTTGPTGRVMSERIEDKTTFASRVEANKRATGVIATGAALDKLLENVATQIENARRPLGRRYAPDLSKAASLPPDELLDLLMRSALTRGWSEDAARLLNARFEIDSSTSRELLAEPRRRP